MNKSALFGGPIKLNETQVLEIYARAWAQERVTDLAKEFGVTSANISAIKCGRSWSRITGHARKKEVMDRC